MSVEQKNGERMAFVWPILVSNHWDTTPCIRRYTLVIEDWKVQSGAGPASAHPGNLENELDQGR